MLTFTGCSTTVKFVLCHKGLQAVDCSLTFIARLVSVVIIGRSKPVGRSTEVQSQYITHYHCVLNDWRRRGAPRVAPANRLITYLFIAQRVQ